MSRVIGTSQLDGGQQKTFLTSSSLVSPRFDVKEILATMTSHLVVGTRKSSQTSDRTGEAAMESL